MTTFSDQEKLKNYECGINPATLLSFFRKNPNEWEKKVPGQLAMFSASLKGKTEAEKAHLKKEWDERQILANFSKLLPVDAKQREEYSQNILEKFDHWLKHYIAEVKEDYAGCLSIISHVVGETEDNDEANPQIWVLREMLLMQIKAKARVKAMLATLYDITVEQKNDCQ